MRSYPAKENHNGSVVSEILWYKHTDKYTDKHTDKKTDIHPVTFV